MVRLLFYYLPITYPLDPFHMTRAMLASARGGKPAFTNYLWFQCNFSHGVDVVRAQVKCSASAPWLVCGPTSASFAKD